MGTSKFLGTVWQNAAIYCVTERRDDSVGLPKFDWDTFDFSNIENSKYYLENIEMTRFSKTGAFRMNSIA